MFQLNYCIFNAIVMDQSVTTVCSLFLAMVLHRDVQQKAQAEIDAHIGHNRLPTYRDKAKLPYVSAVLKEVLRWNPPAPLGKPIYYINVGPDLDSTCTTFRHSP